MKKFFLSLVVGIIAFSSSVFAANKPTYLEEAAGLGSVAGQGLACRAKKYHKFELIARAILVSKAKNDKMQREGLQVFNDELVAPIRTQFVDDGFAVARVECPDAFTLFCRHGFQPVVDAQVEEACCRRSGWCDAEGIERGE